MSSRKPSRERSSRKNREKEKEEKPSPSPSPLPPPDEDKEQVREPEPVEEVIEEINPHVIHKELFKDTFDNLFSSFQIFNSSLQPQELLIGDKVPIDNDDVTLEYSSLINKVKEELEQQTNTFKTIEESVKIHAWRTFIDPSISQLPPKEESQIFENNTLIDFDEIVESENVAPVHEIAKKPQYPLPLLSYADKNKTIKGPSFSSSELFNEISQIVFKEKSEESKPATPTLEGHSNHYYHHYHHRDHSHHHYHHENRTPRSNAYNSKTPRSSITPSRAIRKGSSHSSLDFYLPKLESLKFERSIFYEASEPLTLTTGMADREGEREKERERDREKEKEWSSPAMSRTKMVLADADKRPWILKPSPQEKETDSKILMRMKERVNYLKNPRINEAKTQDSFDIIPKRIEFREYEVGKVYSQTVTLKNMTTVGQKLRVIPPADDDLSVSVVKTSPDFLIAPGMITSYSVDFSPKKKGEYNDNFVLVMESGLKLSVPIYASQPSSKLIFPHIFDIGPCLLGDVKTAHFECKNSGNGSGIFAIIPESEFKAGYDYFKNIAETPRELERLQVPPFEIIPRQFKLAPGAQISVEVAFSPLGDPAQYSIKYRIVGDNGFSDPFTLEGLSCSPIFEITSISGNDLSVFAQEDNFPSTDFVLHDLLFDSLNPATQQTKKVSVRNITPVELQYKWKIVVPSIERPDFSHLPGISPPPPSELPVKATGSPFSISPHEGSFLPGATCEFSFTFTPEEIETYAHLAQLVVCNVPVVSLLDIDEDLIEEAENISDTKLQQNNTKVNATLAEIGMKGCGRACDVALHPPSLILPSVCVIGQTYTKTIQLVNNSTSRVSFEFQHANAKPNQFAISLNPIKGTTPANSITKSTLRFTPKVIGEFYETITCDVSNLGRLHFLIKGKAIGARIALDRSTVDFGLVRIGTEANTHINIRNPFKIPSSWSIHPVDPDVDISKLWISPSSGTLGPLENSIIRIRYQPTNVESLRVGMVLKVKDGDPGYLVLRAEAQSPKVCLSHNTFDLMSGFVGIPITRTVQMKNLTLIPTQFSWEEIDKEDYSVKFEPRFGAIGAHETLKVIITFTPNKIPEVADIEALLCCDVMDMELPIGCILKVKIEGMSISYSILNTTRPAILSNGGKTSQLGSQMGLDWVVHALPTPKPFPIDPFSFSNSPPSLPGPILSQSTLSINSTPALSQAPSAYALSHPQSQPSIPSSFSVRPLPRAATQPSVAHSADVSPSISPTLLSSSLPPNKALSSESPSISFTNIPIFSQQSTFLVFRNNTSMPTRFTFSLKKYNPPIKDIRPTTPDTPGRPGSAISTPRTPRSVTTLSSQESAPPSAAGKKRKPRLSDVEDKTSHFQSQKGKQYEQAINKRRIQAELQTLAGLAIWVEPESGILQAYEEINVKVLCYADMCGSYSDVLLFQASGLAPLLFPINVDVQGSPLVIWRNSMGLDMYSNPPTIHWAPLPASPAPALSKRIFKLTNGAPFHVQLKWKLYKVVELDGVQEAPVPTDDQEEDECAYTISPKQIILKAHQTQEFSVQLVCKKVGVYHYRMEPIAFAQGRRVYIRKDSPSDTLVLPASPQLPAMPIDLVARAIRSRLDPSRTTLRLQCYITGDSSNQSSHSTRNQSVILTNNTEARMKFSVRTQQPFEIIKMVARRPMDEVDDEGEAPSSELLPRTAVDGYEVAQRASVEVYVGFEPPTWLFSVDSFQDRYLEGSIDICFGDGSTQAITVNATVIYPQLYVAPLVIDFGKVHGRSTQSIMLQHSKYHPMLRWSIEHVPEPVANPDTNGVLSFSSKTSKVPHISAAQPTQHNTPSVYDQPSCFLIHPLSAVLLGGPNHTGDPPSSINITFKPDHMVAYKSKYRISTQVGNTIEVEFKGEGVDVS